MYDRRKHERRPAKGSIRFFVNGAKAVEVAACVLDKSAEGFRASHEYPALSAGQEVSLSSPTGQRARVMWTRICSDRVESGFLILR
jgi:hypothetical protein